MFIADLQLCCIVVYIRHSCYFSLERARVWLACIVDIRACGRGTERV